MSDLGPGPSSPWFTVIDRKDWMGQTPPSFPPVPLPLRLNISVSKWSLFQLLSAPFLSTLVSLFLLCQENIPWQWSCFFLPPLFRLLHKDASSSETTALAPPKPAAPPFVPPHQLVSLPHTTAWLFLFGFKNTTPFVSWL